jgi:hypothetical protein
MKLAAVPFAVAAALATPACGHQPEPSQLGIDARVRDEVLTVVRAYSDDLSARDWDSLIALFWPGATLTSIRPENPQSEPTLHIVPVTERVAEMAPILRAKPMFESSLASPAVLVQGDLAMVWAPSEARIGDVDDPTRVPGVDAITLLAKDGSWKVISLAYQADAEANQLPEGGSRQSILTTIERYYSDFSTRNWRGFARHFWTGATINTALGPSDSDSARIATADVPTFIASVRDELDRETIFEIRLGSAQVVNRRNVAQVWASYRVRLGDVNVSDWSGVNAFTLIRFRSRWRIAALSYDADTNREGLSF